MNMKKTNASYLLLWVGVPALAAALIAVLGTLLFLETSPTVAGLAVLAAICIVVAIPMVLESRMKKLAAAQEQHFAEQGFFVNYKFQASNAIYYISESGRMGVIYRGNPTQLQFIDLRQVSNVHVNDGKFGAVTSQVSCEFLLEGKKVRIVTLKVTRGTLSLKDRRVLEAIAKAEQLCSMILTAQSRYAQ